MISEEGEDRYLGMWVCIYIMHVWDENIETQGFLVIQLRNT